MRVVAAIFLLLSAGTVLLGKPNCLTVVGLPEAVVPQKSYAIGYWIWAGRSIDVVPKELAASAPIYVHQATFERQRRPIGRSPKLDEDYFSGLLRRQGIGPVSLQPHPVIITYRLEALPSPSMIRNLFVQDSAIWRLRGNQVAGIQIDFDSPTSKLERYVRFLKSLKRVLGSDYKLSVTGLADWASESSRQDLNNLSAEVDEVVYQLYVGRSQIPMIESYASKLTKAELPFKIGALSSQIGSLPEELFSSPNYRGTVIFAEER